MLHVCNQTMPNFFVIQHDSPVVKTMKHIIYWRNANFENVAKNKKSRD